MAAAAAATSCSTGGRSRLLLQPTVSVATAQPVLPLLLLRPTCCSPKGVSGEELLWPPANTTE